MTNDNLDTFVCELLCGESATLFFRLRVRVISSSSVFRAPWLRGPLVRPAPRRPRPPQPSRSCRPSPASSSRWPPTPERMKIDQILSLHWIEVKTPDNKMPSYLIILRHLCLSIARLDLEQRSYVLERGGVLLQLGVPDGEVVQVVSLVRLVTILRTHKQYEWRMQICQSKCCPYVMCYAYVVCTWISNFTWFSVISPETSPPAELFPSWYLPGIETSRGTRRTRTETWR